MPATPREIDILTEAVWSGEISENRFMECALEAGMNVAEVNAILREIRSEDGELT